MQINARTKISEVINHNPASIDVIASINKHFRKLKNPVLRKLLASKVTIADASKIGGCQINDLLNKLAGIGFQIEGDTPETNQNVTQMLLKKVSITESTKVQVLDVRKDIKEGNDPFNKIMKAVKTMQENEVLHIINTFEPIPLIKILEEKGFLFEVIRENDVVNTYFKQGKPKAEATADENLTEKQISDFEKVKANFAQKIIEVDVRSLEMPLPMVTILDELEKLPEQHALFVHHKKVPAFLLPELEKRGYQWVTSEQSESDVKLMIYRK